MIKIIQIHMKWQTNKIVTFSHWVDSNWIHAFRGLEADDGN